MPANRAIDRYRRRRWLPRPSDGPGNVDGLLAERLDLARVLRRLPRRQREVTVLRYLADRALTAQTASFAGAPAPPIGVGGLPLAGSIGHKNRAVLSADQAWLAADRGPVVETTDGGASWAEVTQLADAGFSTGAPGNLTFLDAHQGWIVEQGLGLWAASDGVHWARPGAPGTSGTSGTSGPRTLGT